MESIIVACITGIATLIGAVPVVLPLCYFARARVGDLYCFPIMPNGKEGIMRRSISGILVALLLASLALFGCG